RSIPAQAVATPQTSAGRWTPSSRAAAAPSAEFAGRTGMTELSTDPFSRDDDKLREECGVFGVFGHQDAAALTALGLHALQHRGQEAAGIVSYDGQQFHSERHFGLVGDSFSERSVIEKLTGDRAIGHVRYSTA